MARVPVSLRPSSQGVDIVLVPENMSRPTSLVELDQLARLGLDEGGGVVEDVARVPSLLEERVILHDERHRQVPQ